MSDVTLGAGPYLDARGREVFSVHPQILAGGAPYRVNMDPVNTETETETDAGAKMPRNESRAAST